MMRYIKKTFKCEMEKNSGTLLVRNLFSADQQLKQKQIDLIEKAPTLLLKI